VGDASPSRPKAPSQAESAAKLGSFLCEDLMAALPSARFDPEPVVGNLRLAVDLPPVRLPILAGWLRFSPLATWWIADRRTHLHEVRLGPAVLVGFPGDYSGHLADQLVGSFRETGLSAVATSFDGDFRGYLVSSRVFRDVPCYETRWMSFYGPWTGEYFNDLARRMAGRFSDLSGPARPAEVEDRAPGIALVVLMIGAATAAWRRPGDLGKISRRIGWVTIAVGLSAALAFGVGPDAVAWASFGLPAWARMMGVVPGVLALAWASQGKWVKAALPFGIGCAVLSASWLVVLMIARGGARWGLKGCSEMARPARTAA
jgi:hypothetical protein